MTEATPADANTQPNYPFQFDARLAWVRECKQQFLLFVLDLASQTPKHKRQWFSFAEIVSACANMANLELDLTKQERALQRLREAVLQGDFVDARGRSTTPIFILPLIRRHALVGL